MSEPLKAALGRITNGDSHDSRDGQAGKGLIRIAPITLTTAFC